MYGLPKYQITWKSFETNYVWYTQWPSKIPSSFAKILSDLLGNIRSSHVKNSSLLINKINNININYKILVRLEIESLYPNIHVSKCIKRLKKHLKKINIALPLLVNKVIKICSLCAKYSFYSMYWYFFIIKNFVYPWVRLLFGSLFVCFLSFLN